MVHVPNDPTRPLDGLTRRVLLRASCGAGVAGFLSTVAGCSLDDVLRRGASDALPSGTPILVLVTLYGGNDGLDMVVPHADPAYAAARGELAQDPTTVLDLGDGLGLNQALPALKAEWEAGHLAIVRGVGYPKPDRSHFRSMDIWQTAAPDAPEQTGWLGRWLDATAGASPDPLQALTIGSVLPPAMVGAQRAAATLELGMPVRKPAWTTRLRALAGETVEGDVSSLVGRSYADALAVDDRLLPMIDGTGSAADPLDEDSEAPEKVGRKGNAGNLGAQLDLVSTCIRAGSPTRAYSVSLNGFDTHAAERETHRALLGYLDTALKDFRASLAGDDRAEDVVVLAHSEFGRRVRANAADGTDHGTAGPVLLLGDGVKGGFHGDQPSLTDLSDGDLKVTTDFRSVYAAVLERVLGTDPRQVLSGAPPALPLFA